MTQTNQVQPSAALLSLMKDNKDALATYATAPAVVQEWLNLWADLSETERLHVVEEIRRTRKGGKA
jgi:hypothetical protein